MNMRRIREILGISCDDFARIYGIPINLVNDWDDRKIIPPDWLMPILERMVSEDKQYLRKCPYCKQFFIDRRKGNIKYCPDCSKKGKAQIAQYDTRKKGIRWKHKAIGDYISNVLNDDPTEFREESNRFYQEVKAGIKSEEEYRTWLEETSARFKKKHKHL